MKEQNAQAASRHSSGKMMWGRLKRGPNLPSKPPIQSSESSTDDLSGSEDSSSSDIDDKEETQKKEESNMPGNGTEDDDDDLVDANDQIKPKHKSGDLSIEIKIGKDKDKSKTLLAGSVFKALAGGSKDGSAGSGSSQKSKEGSSFTMKWDTERSVRANQDYQREKEEMSMRDLLKHLARRQQHLARQQGHHQVPNPASAFLRPVASAPNLTAGHGSPFGGLFLRLEQDWRETHMNYLQHRSATAVAQNTLNMPPRMTRPNSAASVRSTRNSRYNRH